MFGWACFIATYLMFCVTLYTVRPTNEQTNNRLTYLREGISLTR
jgi:hypothetical protein